jgi:hypothetical protein
MSNLPAFIAMTLGPSLLHLLVLLLVLLVVIYVRDALYVVSRRFRNG